MEELEHERGEWRSAQQGSNGLYLNYLPKRLVKIARLGAKKNFVFIGVGQRGRYAVPLRVNEIGDAVAAGAFQAHTPDGKFGKTRCCEWFDCGGEPRREDGTHSFEIFVAVNYQRIRTRVGVVGVVPTVTDPVDFASPQPILGLLFGNTQ